MDEKAAAAEKDARGAAALREQLAAASSAEVRPLDSDLAFACLRWFFGVC